MDSEALDATTLEKRAQDAEGRGALREALHFWGEAFRLRRSENSPEAFVLTATRFAAIQLSLGEYHAAERTLAEARAVFKNGFEKRSEAFLQYLETESLLEKSRRNWADAFTSTNLAAILSADLYGPTHVATLERLTERADIEVNAGLIEQAEKTLAHVLPHLEASSGLNLLVGAYKMQAVIHLNRHEYEPACALLENCWRALSLRPRDRFELTPVLKPLAIAYMGLGRPADASMAMEEVIRLERAATDEPMLFTVFTLGQLALLRAAMGRWYEAIAIAKEAETLWQEHATRVFTGGTDEQRGSFADAMRKDSVRGVAVLLARALADPSFAAECLEVLWRRKGIATTFLEWQQRALHERNDAEANRLFGEWWKVKRLIAELWLDRKRLCAPDDGTAYQRHMGQLMDMADQREKDLSARLKINFQEMPTTLVRDVAEALPDDTVLIEYVLGFRFAADDYREQFGGGEAYFAFVVKPGNSAMASCVEIGAAAEINELIAELDRLILRSETELTDLLRLLHTKLWQSVADQVGEARHVVIALDEELARVPFAALQNKSGDCLIDEHVLSFIGCGSEILRRSPATNPGPAVVMVPGPPRVLRSSIEDLRFGSLPYALQEAAHVKAALDGGARLLRGPEASKNALLSCRNPRVLHLATHGFLLADTANPEGAFELGHPMRDSSLLRSGVAMSDDVVTALEIAGMDLSQTEMVVLSACMSGRGEIKTGEAVYGLRRSFFVAGAKRLVTSLWAVSDRHTAELMELFYRRLQSGEAPAEALRAASLEMRERAPHPVYWAAFELFGETRALQASA